MKLFRKGKGFFISVLGVAQYGMPQMGAVDTELVGSPGNGAQGQPAVTGQLFSDLIFRDRGLSLRGNLS